MLVTFLDNGLELRGSEHTGTLAMKHDVRSVPVWGAAWWPRQAPCARVVVARASPVDGTRTDGGWVSGGSGSRELSGRAATLEGATAAVAGSTAPTAVVVGPGGLSIRRKPSSQGGGPLSDIADAPSARRHDRTRPNTRVLKRLRVPETLRGATIAPRCRSCLSKRPAVRS